VYPCDRCENEKQGIPCEIKIYNAVTRNSMLPGICVKLKREFLECTSDTFDSFECTIEN
jgi:hypothetical protein